MAEKKLATVFQHYGLECRNGYVSAFYILRLFRVPRSDVKKISRTCAGLCQKYDIAIEIATWAPNRGVGARLSFSHLYTFIYV